MRAFSDFRSISCVVLGAITAALIALPWSASLGSSLSLPAILIFAALGALMGYRKRSSTGFFYFCLVAVVVLASLLSSHFQ